MHCNTLQNTAHKLNTQEFYSGICSSRPGGYYNALQNTAHMLRTKDILFQESAQVDPVALAAEEAKTRKDREDTLQRAVYAQYAKKNKSTFKSISQRVKNVMPFVLGTFRGRIEGDSMH